MEDKSHKIWKYTIIIIIIAIVSYVNIQQGERRFQEKQCKAWIEAVEDYYSEKECLPASQEMLELAKTTRKPIHYLKIDSLCYFIYFELDADNYRIYHSDIATWRSEPKSVLHELL